MKGRKWLAALIVVAAIGYVISGIYNEVNNASRSIQVSESSGFYKFSTKYSKEKWDAVTAYVDRYLQNDGNDFSISGKRVEGDFVLNNKTAFYLKSKPGQFTLSMDKDKNSSAAIQNIKNMCDGIKKEVNR